LLPPEDPPEVPPDELVLLEEYPAIGATVFVEHDANAKKIAARSRRFFIVTPARITLGKDTLYFVLYQRFRRNGKAKPSIGKKLDIHDNTILESVSEKEGLAVFNFIS